MKRLFKFLIISILVSATIFSATIIYIKSTFKKSIPEDQLKEIVENINSAPALPKSFKDNYEKVYPDIFEKKFTSVMLDQILNGREYVSCLSRQVADNFHMTFNADSRLMDKLHYCAFVWYIEDNTSQEKCLEYLSSKYDFLNNAIGIDKASLTYFNKTLDLLSNDEQLGLILMLKNPAMYNKFRHPDIYEQGVEQLKEK